MKTVITGHTSGVGKILHAYFQGEGLSRSNGYDIDKDFDKVVEAAKGADLFINNAYRDQQQLKLFHALKDHVGKMIVMGSISRIYPELIPTDYVQDKQELYEACRLHNLQPDTCPVLHLDLSFIEGTDVNFQDPTAFTSDNYIKYTEILEAVKFWLKNPNVQNIEFVWKCTPFVRKELERINPNLDPSRITF